MNKHITILAIGKTSIYLLFFALISLYFSACKTKAVQVVPVEIKTEFDTVVILDPKTYKETIYVLKDNELIEDFMLMTYPGIVSYSDTIVTIDPTTYAQRVEIKNGKMQKAYLMMIEFESTKEKPNMDKIQEWRRKGTVYE
ncbi:MAG: hypothetical protein LC107_04160 [Chitinophagales bacterium]|nr:hypothetical protein [Chitinophagales bacterium]